MAQLTCRGAPAPIAEAVATWFAAGGLALPGDVVWQVQVEPDPWFTAPGAGTLWQGEIALEPQPDGALRIAHPAGIDIRVEQHRPHAVWRVAAEAQDELLAELPSLAMLALIFCLRRLGWHHVHAATAVAPDGTGWLLTGPTGSGKSTTVAALGRAGWRVGGDDAAFLCAAPTTDDVVVHPWHGTIALRDGGRRVLGLASDADLTVRGKTRQAHVDRGYALAAPFTPRVVAACRVGAETTYLEPLTQADALALLVTQSAWVALEPALATPHLHLLERLLRRASTVRLVVAPDVVGDPHRLLHLPGT